MTEDTASKVDDSALTNQVTVAPGMCSGGSLVFGRIGDWTWEAVSAASGTNVHTATTPDGRPAYLSFYYYHVRGGREVHPHGLTFGDELQVCSRVFQLGSQSVLTLHRLAPAELGLSDEPLDAQEAYDDPHPDCLYAETFNRWIARSAEGTNTSLSNVTPPDFAYKSLPSLPNTFSPRALVGRARHVGSFYSDAPQGFTPAGPTHTTEYPLDVVRDINGAGLMYFASYFSIFDTALLELWHALGRSDDQFLQRKVIDQKVGYFGNADPGAVFSITVNRYRSTTDPNHEIVDMAMREATTNHLLAVSGIELSFPSAPTHSNRNGTQHDKE